MGSEVPRRGTRLLWGVPSPPTLGARIPSVDGQVPAARDIEGVVECEKEQSTGAITGPKTEELAIKYKKCEIAGHSCNSPTAGAGKINKKLLDGELVYLDSGHTKVGLRFKPQTGTVIAEYECPTIPLHVVEEGELIDEQLGDIEFAETRFKGVFAEGPLRAQQWAYAEQKGTEQNELEYAEWKDSGMNGTAPDSPYVPAYANDVITAFPNTQSTWDAQSEYKGADILVEL